MDTTDWERQRELRAMSRQAIERARAAATRSRSRGWLALGAHLAIGLVIGWILGFLGRP